MLIPPEYNAYMDVTPPYAYKDPRTQIQCKALVTYAHNISAAQIPFQTLIPPLLDSQGGANPA